jgi:universal stress protein A
MASFQRVLCPVDLSPASGPVLKQALDIARASQGHVQVLHVQSLPMHLREDTLVWLEASAEPLSQVAERAARKELELLLKEHVPPEDGERVSSSVEIGAPVPTILRVAEETKADLLVVGSRKPKGIDRLLLGSVAERVVRGAGCPVMVVHPETQGET